MANETHTVDTLLALIVRDGVKRAVAATRKPPLPSRVLQELATRTEEPLARQFVAAYPLAPSALLEQLAQSATEPEALVLLAANPRTPPHLLSTLAAHPAAPVRAQAALHPQIPPRELLGLAADPAPLVRRTLATNPELRLPHFAQLAADADPAVRLELSGHGALPEPVARVLGADASGVVRLQCVATARVEEEVLVGWAVSDEEDVQLALARREDLTPTARHWLVQSPHASVRRLVRAVAKLDDVDLLFLATRGAPDERAWVAGRDLLARPLQNLLAQDAAVAVREALARNLSLDEDIARYFVGQAEAAVCAALAVNPAVPLELVQELAATRHPEVLQALAYREWLEPELVRFLLGHSAEFRGHWAIQGRPPGELPADVAAVLLADPRPSVQALGVAGHVALRAPDLWDFARAAAPVVRQAAVRHPRASDDLVADLRADPAPEVAQAAEEVQTARARAAAATAAATATSRRASAAPAASSGGVRAGSVGPVHGAAAPTPAAEAGAGPAGARPAARLTSRPAPGIFDKLKRIFFQ